MAAFLEEACHFSAQEHGPVILVDQLLEGFFLGGCEPFSLLLEIESFELRSGLLGELIAGSAPQLLVANPRSSW
ncbi:MAG: hypothetical protein GY856_14390 [bacterium]|nr:hypothetical protein [bacterium]